MIQINKKYKIPPPNNEGGVVFLFGACFGDFKFSNVRIRVGYPDATAYSKVLNRQISIEFEYVSQNFINHKHEITQVDLIICWRHDVYSIKKPVLELKTGNLYIFRNKNRIDIFDWINDDRKLIKDNFIP